MFFQFPARIIDPLCVVVNVNGIDLRMEVNTGAAVSIISRLTYCTTWPACRRPHLQPSSTRLRTCSGPLIEVLSSISVTATYQNESQTLQLLIVPTDGPSLLGRDWLKVLYLDWKQFHHLHVGRDQTLQHVLDKHTSLFKEEMGTLRGTEVTIHIQENAHPCSFIPGQGHTPCVARLKQSYIVCKMFGSSRLSSFLSGQPPLCLFLRRMGRFTFVRTSKSL